MKSKKGLVVYLHHGANPHASVDGVDAEDGGGGTADDLAEQPDVIAHHQ